MKRILSGLSALAVSLAAAAAVAPAAGAVDPTKGYNGICTGRDALTGVTVVIDFQELNGNGGVPAPTITRCSPNPRPGTERNGIEALQDAGIAVTGTDRWGLGFVCRLENRPSPTEEIPIGSSSTPGYTESCIDTPPAAAYWSYWHADGSGTKWTYSNYGALGRNVTPGGFEGWSFSLNKGPDTNPPPRVTPRNPAVGPNRPTVSLSVDDLDRKITLGQSTSLSWTSTNVKTITADSVSPGTGGGSWSGALAVPSGTRTITPTARGTYTYTIKATGTGGTVYSTATLTVE
ncbi:ABC transporter substrate-binding protein [Streptoalloteichus hindustanus]|uniref:Uncharacterized protein n=1 Tax=Streptoalloteichus hindustanus TaxID=2017 RepID=A0A1M5CKY8_STRHI|nr:ABC transporter substrate-binding protein [Streptoalloteichus hindustanus]SHF55267.1 hypothetical protein SAMN05444320_10468 [Streptoalloteichus hindustanus]